MISPYAIQKKLRLRTAYQHEQTEEYQSGVKKVVAYMNYHEVRQIVDIAKTIMARDYKGPIKVLEVKPYDERHQET